MTATPPGDVAAIEALSRDVLKLYLTRDRQLIEELYVCGEDGEPIIFDVGDSFFDGSPWVRSHAIWSRSLEHYFDLMESDCDTPRVTAMRYIEPQIIADGGIGSFVSLLAIGMKTADREWEQLTRYTLVLRKCAGRWKIWNEHFSIAQSQELILGSAGKDLMEA